MKTSIIVAIGKNREIGKDNDLLWHISEDLKHFKKITSGHAIIMGRKTYESIGRPLPKRTNIVITRQKDYSPDGVIILSSLTEAIDRAKEVEEDEVFIIGGGEIYKQAVGVADKLYITLVDGEYDADVFFPEYRHIYTKEISRDEREGEGLKYAFVELEKQ